MLHHTSIPLRAAENCHKVPCNPQHTSFVGDSPLVILQEIQQKTADFQSFWQLEALAVAGGGVDSEASPEASPSGSS